MTLPGELKIIGINLVRIESAESPPTGMKGPDAASKISRTWRALAPSWMTVAKSCSDGPQTYCEYRAVTDTLSVGRIGTARNTMHHDHQHDGGNA